MKADWFEILPEYCPPSDANRCVGTYYRIAQGDPATSADFFSQRKLQPDKVFTGKGIDECIARAISLFLMFHKLKSSRYEKFIESRTNT